jgi:hypothetical protein
VAIFDMIERNVVGVVSPSHGSQQQLCSRSHQSLFRESKNPKIL